MSSFNPTIFLRKCLPRDPAGWVLIISSFFVVQIAIWFIHLYHGHVVDDAYISFRYTQNWVLGRGLVFNPGEYVEGYTNFLWIVLLAPFYALSRAVHWDFTTCAIWLNVVLAVVDLVLVYLIGRKLFRQKWVVVSLPLVLLALDNAYLGYAISGLENHLLIACSLGAILVWLSRPRHVYLWTGILLALVTMTRPDGILGVLAFALSGGLSLVWADSSSPPEPRRETAKRLLATLGVFTVLYGAYFLWRMNYYGSLLPNTFYLKVGSTFDGVRRGLEYTRSFFDWRVYLPVVALLSLAAVKNGTVRWLLCLCLLQFPYVIYVGGDFYSGHRFYIVLLPVLYLLVAAGLQEGASRVRSSRLGGAIAARPAVLALGALGLIGASGWWVYRFAARGFETGPYANEIVMWGGHVDNNIRYMKWLASFVQPNTSMALGDIGAAGFFLDVKVIDTYGVIDPVIARTEVKGFGKGKAGHEKKGSVEYIMGRKPTYVKFGFVPGNLEPYGYYIFNEFPPELKVDGLWVREELRPGRFIPETALGFVPADIANWEQSGEAFRSAPTQKGVPRQRAVFGQSGAYLNSFTQKGLDRATGRLLSPPFPLVGDLMILRVGGGQNIDKLRVSLIIDDQRTFSATGRNSEILGCREWAIEPYKGKMARLEVVDDAIGDWGHIMVDEVVQWERPTSVSNQLISN